MTESMRIRSMTSLPLREVSALATRRRSGGGSQLLAVGDEDFAVVQADVEGDDALGETSRYDLFLPLVGTGIDLRGGSGFEGIACHGDEAFLLQEEESRILVFDAEFSTLLQVIGLSVPADTPGFGRAWNSVKDRNSRAEGLLLLEAGHVLVAKQKDPACLIEFGPAGAVAAGIRRRQILAADEHFERGATMESELVPLAAWSLEDTAGRLLPTLNDISSGDESVFLISSKGRAIARLDTELLPSERLESVSLWTLGDQVPGGGSSKPEGLAVLPECLIVGFDRSGVGDNVAVCDPPT